MKMMIAMLTVLAASLNAQADGWKCSSESGLNIQIYNQTQPELGTRSAAVMVVSDDYVSQGRRTIAKFTAAEGLVAQNGATYTGKVDLRFNNTGRKGELIAGTKLGEIDMLVVGIDFSYAQPVADGEVVDGELTVLKRNGEEIVDSLLCERHLKH